MERRVDTARLATVTSTTLLSGLKDPGNEVVWRAYVDRYRPLILGYLARLDVAAAEAEDVTQEALLAFSQAYRAGKYDRERGRLSSWLFGIVHNELRRHRRTDERRRARSGSDHGLEELPATDELAAVWEDEWRHAVLRACIEEVRREVQPATVRAFELFALRGLPAEEVARQLDMTPNAVFGAKRRVLERVRELRPLMEDVW